MSTDIDFQITECSYQLGHINVQFMSLIEHVEARTFIDMRSSL